MAEWVRFPSTLWTRMRLVRDRDAGAVREFVDRYRVPVFRFIRNAGFGEADAEELAQDVFTRLLAEDVLSKAERDKGRFRSFLLAVTRNVLREERRRRVAAKRGGGAGAVSLEGQEPEAPEPAEEEFDRAWMNNLLTAALASLEKEHPPHYRALRAHLEGGDYREIAAELGKSLQDVKNYIHRARLKLTELLRLEVSRYASTSEEYEDEVRYLARFLKP